MPTTTKLSPRRLVLIPLLLLAVVGNARTSEAASESAQAVLLDDEEVAAKFSKAREYNLSKICYQNNTFLDCRHEIGPPGQRHTLAGMEFPWKHPGGTFKSGTTRKFVWPPNIKATKMRVATVGFANDDLASRLRTAHRRPAWKWPAGATFFELHYHPRGWPFELRVLERDDGDGFGFENYTAKVFRPFTSEGELPFEIRGRTERRKVHSTHPRNPFVAEGEVTLYPDVKTDWNRIVRTRIWSDDTGHSWHHAGRGDKWLSPKNYQGWITGSDETTCVKCHKHAADHVSVFEAARDWYGHIPGSDGIFSFDPIDRRSVSTSGPHGGGFRWKDN